MNRVTALKGYDINISRQHLSDLSWGLAEERSLRDVQTGDLTAGVVSASLSVDHRDGWVLHRSGSVAFLRFKGLVWLVLGFNFVLGDRGTLVCKENLGTYERVRVCECVYV